MPVAHPSNGRCGPNGPHSGISGPIHQMTPNAMTQNADRMLAPMRTHVSTP
ncbi:hypothetical protein CLV56_1156 [Mumia flava]|uniref:Uncharacterized protein n=1 Tax=Mumia flava TaxID=1348852 RepID=A0A2M9BG58_9ACTN|nr:hypothetical protein CLV56_1156 [Mumia flava]